MADEPRSFPELVENLVNDEVVSPPKRTKKSGEPPRRDFRWAFIEVDLWHAHIVFLCGLALAALVWATARDNAIVLCSVVLCFGCGIMYQLRMIRFLLEQQERRDAGE